MRKGILGLCFFLCVSPLTVHALTAGDGPAEQALPPAEVIEIDPDQYVEDFADISSLTSSGWSLQNLSEPLGILGWFQGDAQNFPAQAGADNSYIAANFENTVGSDGVISNWLISPVLPFAGTSELRFWTRVPSGTVNFPDRLEVRLSTSDTPNVGSSATSVGDFTQLLLTINPNLNPSPGGCPPGNGGYPQDWCEIVINNDNGLPRAGRGRIGLRYFVTGAGPSGVNSNYLGIDSFYYENLPPGRRIGRGIPTLSRFGVLVLVLVMLALGLWASRQRKPSSGQSA